MALNDEVLIDDSTSKRSLTTGNLLIVMPKLDVKTCPIAKKFVPTEKPTMKTPGLTGTVNIRNIVIDDSEIPPLI